MGTYTVWIDTGAAGSKAASNEALELIAPYDETENDIPGSWPGLSFDYCETVTVRRTDDSVADLRAGAPPDALITGHGQILAEQPHPADDTAEYRPVTYGIENMVTALLESPEPIAGVAVMKWHC